MTKMACAGVVDTDVAGCDPECESESCVSVWALVVSPSLDKSLFVGPFVHVPVLLILMLPDATQSVRMNLVSDLGTVGVTLCTEESVLGVLWGMCWCY